MLIDGLILNDSSMLPVLRAHSSIASTCAHKAAASETSNGSVNGALGLDHGHGQADKVMVTLCVQPKYERPYKGLRTRGRTRNPSTKAEKTRNYRTG